MARAKVVENAIAMVLVHTGVDKVAGKTFLGDALRQEFDTLDGVAENNALVDVELFKESHEALNFLFFLDERVVLRHSFESQLVHQVDLVGILHPIVHE